MPTFAAIIPNYNDGARIGGALAALFAQSRPFDEILIIDDGSTDDSVDCIGRLIAGKSNVRLIRKPKNSGVVAAINTGINECRADFIWLCSANDTYNTRVLEDCCRALTEYPHTVMLCGNANFWYKKEDRTLPVFMDLPQTPHFIVPEAFRVIVRRSPLTFFGGGVILKREALLEVQCLREELRWHSDWMIFYLLAFRYGAYFIPEPFVTAEVVQGSFSSKAAIWEYQRPVIHAVIMLLARDYSDEKEMWKYAALLPTYNLRMLSILLLPECRWYVTPLLLWRMLVHTLAYNLKHYLPRTLLIRLRTIFKV